jgi:hypothetical protein
MNYSLNYDYVCIRKDLESVLHKLRRKERFVGGTGLSKKHEGNKLCQTWLTKEQFEQLQDFLTSSQLEKASRNSSDNFLSGARVFGGSFCFNDCQLRVGGIKK